MIFTSTTRESADRPIWQSGVGYAHDTSTMRPEDPTPFVGWNTKRRTKQPTQHGEMNHFFPRPDYRSPANPILVEARPLIAAGWKPSQILFHMTPGEPFGEYLPEQIEHARKVLIRLTNYRKDA